ncbi:MULTISPECIES: anti-sigma factor [Amycolatopsis]|uniref:Regulator of SigK n=2 Tax=Amycolatopsis TaxID=1813 RepID=A0A1I3MRL7_9PSEU|nr:anti-sigma factor [Amycolatopsis sacchari]SFI99627.1 Anti-sigma-K factor RskA [Amycolatopsis sacchari]
MTTPDAHLLTGAYAIDALDEFERRQFERHLAQCPECAREVAELRATGARLALAVSEAPPPRLKAEVLTRIAGVRQEPPGTERTEPARGARGLALRLVSVAAAVAVVVAVALGVVVVRTQGQLTAARGQLAQQNAVTQLLSAPDLRAVSTEGGSVLLSQRLDRGLLVLSGMPDQPANTTYQAWAIVGGTAKSLGVLGPRGTSALAFAGLRGVQQIAMTVEPAGGSPQPTTSPVARFAV